MIIQSSEGTTLGSRDWCKHLRCSDSEFDSLVLQQVFQRQEELFSLRFIGLIALQKSVLFCTPALENPSVGNNVVNRVRSVDRMLRTYHARSLLRNTISDRIASTLYSDPLARSKAKSIDVFASLLEYTRSFGFHEAEKISTSRVNHLRTNWGATLAHQPGYPTKTGVIYPNPVGVCVATQLSELGTLQAIALVELYQAYEAIADLDATLDRDIIERARAIADVDFEQPLSIADFLSERLDQSNKDHDKDLIHLLLAHYRAENESFAVPGQSLYGTVNFPIVWEDICRYAIGAVEEEEISRISNPIYQVAGQSYPAGKQQPDIVFRRGNTTYILDAKYYPRFPDTRPSLEDVRKQFYYGLSYERDDDVELVFLFPAHTSALVEYTGFVQMERVDDVDNRFGRVHCLSLDWIALTNCYADRLKAADTLEKIVELISERRKRRQK